MRSMDVPFKRRWRKKSQIEFPFFLLLTLPRTKISVVNETLIMNWALWMNISNPKNPNLIQSFFSFRRSPQRRRPSLCATSTSRRPANSSAKYPARGRCFKRRTAKAFWPLSVRPKLSFTFQVPDLTFFNVMSTFQIYRTKDRLSSADLPGIIWVGRRTESLSK